MKSGFKDPIAPKTGIKSTTKSFWNFDAPPYDQRSSNFVSAGVDYGIAHRQPVGHPGNPKSTSPELPQGRVHTMQVDET